MSSFISRLPESATQLISAHVVVVTPVLLVKELLDNAIDAKATSVEILVSRDTISRIEIRDDGVGIHPDDYDALGRRGYTSKLRNMEELGDVVGKTLGFRGEALASVNSMAEVTITTKISTEPVAHVLRLIPNEGGILTQKSTSAPVGTTVCVTKLFGRLPVREQMAAKEAKKTLDKIQELLRSYAMTRPQLKLMLKILQTPTTIWSYSPKRNATPMEAALQLFGTEVASNCLIKRFQTMRSSSESHSSTQDLSEHIANSFTLEAILINPDADLQKVPRGHYFSVDGRPINDGRGTTKRLLSVYIEHLRLSTSVKITSDCFIRLSIFCPPGTYDANIEPSKDDVLFSDEQTIMDAFRHLCGELYKPTTVDRDEINTANYQEHSVSTISSLGQAQIRRPLQSHTQLSIPDDTPKSPQNSPKIFPEGACYDPKNSVDERSQETGISINFKPINAKTAPGYQRLVGSSNWQSRTPPERNQWNVDMSVDLSERYRRSHQQQDHEITMTTARTLDTSGHPSSQKTAEITSPSETSLLNSETSLKYLPVSPLTPEPPILRHIMAPPGDLDVPRSYKAAQPARLHLSTVPGGPYRSPVASPSDGRPKGVPAVPPSHSHTALRRHRHKQPPWTPPSSDKKTRHVDASQINPAHSQDADGLRQTQISFNGTQTRHLRGRAQGEVIQTQARSEQPLNRVEPDAHVDMHDMFSTARKNLHFQLSQTEDDQFPKVDRGGRPRRHQQPSRQRQPFSIIQTNTFRNSEAPQEDREPIATTLPTGDPRAYLLRRQKSMVVEGSGPNPRTLRRLKSSLLPLENTLPEYQLHDLSWTTRISSSMLDELVQWTRKYDEYVIHGTFFDGLDLSLADGRAVEAQLQKLLAEQKENIGNRSADNGRVTIDLQATLKGKGVADAPKT
ncbi:hypothetical protein F5X97DRAFT_345932 [Nemania serpens]|nr:hypothetical protein F5X97DRAFT_345932 [Nemania serpens]